MPDAPRPPQNRNAPPPPPGKSADSVLVNVIIAVVVFLMVAAALGSFFTSVMGSYVNLIQWFYTRNWQRIYITAAIIFALVNAGLLGAAIFIIKRYNALRKEIPEKEIISHLISPEKEFEQNWQDIQGLMASENPSDWNMAILRADAELDDLLAHLGYEGETIAERFKIVDPTKLTSMDRVWSAHRLRNAIAHDPLQQYTREMLTHALQSYEIAFQELGVLHEAEV